MATRSSSSYWLAILPWLQLSTEVRFGDVRFVSVDAAQPGKAVAELGSISADCAQVLRSFRLSAACSITRCTLLIPDDWDTCVPLDDGTQARFSRMRDLLMLAAFAANRYGYQNPANANASMFQLQIATFASPPGGVSLFHRGHDGQSLTCGAKWGDPLFYVPRQCNAPWPCSIDVGLVSSLNLLDENDTLARRLRLALPFFVWANTLADTSSWEVEIIALVATLEKLLGKGKKSGVAEEMLRLLRPYDSVPVRNARLTRPNITAKADEEEDPVLRHWVRELYCVRNSLVHPKPCDTGNLAWSPYEHLTMGAFLFPLVVKLLLAENGLYNLTMEDKAACDAIDMLLAKTAWFNREEFDDSKYHRGEATTWAATLEQVKRARRQKECAEIAKRMLQHQQ